MNTNAVPDNGISRKTVGICGLGTVGSGTYNLLRRNGGEIARKVGTEVQVVHVGCRRDPPDCDLSDVRVSRDIFEVARDPDVDILVELIGGVDTACDLVMEAVRHGKHVVTANKALIAEKGEAIFALAEAKGVQIKFEASVCGGIPIVKAIREGLVANRIQGLAGIINGTTNYILTEMEKPGASGYETALAEAQQKGYAEADPTFDVEGIDAAHKLTILSSIAFGTPLNFKDVYTQGISGVDLDDIRYTGELGYRIKHLAITRQSDKGVELRVHPALVSTKALLAQVNGVMNAVMVNSDAAGTTMYYGAGAGAGPTASSVVADLIDIVRNDTMGVPNRGFVVKNEAPEGVIGIKDTLCPHYLKLEADDIPGVMAKISSVLGQHDISIESLIQKDVGEGRAPIVMVTNEVKESVLTDAVREIERLPYVKAPVNHIRVLA